VAGWLALLAAAVPLSLAQDCGHVTITDPAHADGFASCRTMQSLRIVWSQPTPLTFEAASLQIVR